MKVKTTELQGAALDWAVTKAEGFDHEVTCSNWGMHGWATKWEQGGPIIEREGISLAYETGDWTASVKGHFMKHFDYSPLIAAMRCYVASKLGDEVEVPNELEGEKLS